MDGSGSMNSQPGLWADTRDGVSVFLGAARQRRGARRGLVVAVPLVNFTVTLPTYLVRQISMGREGLCK